LAALVAQAPFHQVPLEVRNGWAQELTQQPICVDDQKMINKHHAALCTMQTYDEVVVMLLLMMITMYRSIMPTSQFQVDARDSVDERGD
jgi:hypothetical protein